VLGLALIGGAAGLAAAADTFVWTDARGVIHLTNAPVDRRFRPFRDLGIRGPAWLGETSFARLIEAAARHAGVDPALVRAMIRVESNFDPAAVSRKGARGLMQLHPRTAADLAVRDSFDPADNLFGGTRYLRHLQERFRGDVRLTLAAYNAGPEAVARHGGIPPYRETREYVRRVLALLGAAARDPSAGPGGRAAEPGPRRVPARFRLDPDLGAFRATDPAGRPVFTNIPPLAPNAPGR
jgi:soluble lytic murein transglycosylase